MLRHRVTEAEDISGGGVVGNGSLYPHCILTLSLLYPGSGGGGGGWCHHHLSKYCKKGKR